MKRKTIVSALVFFLFLGNGISAGASEGFYGNNTTENQQTETTASDKGSLRDGGFEGPEEPTPPPMPVGEGLAVMLVALGAYGVSVFNTSRKNSSLR